MMQPKQFLPVLFLVIAFFANIATASATRLDPTHGNIVGGNDILDLSQPYLVPVIDTSLSNSYAARLTNMPKNIINDLLSNFWTGSATEGYITPTWMGVNAIGQPYPYSRGGIWGAGTLYNVLYNYYKLTNSADTKNRLIAEWKWIKNAFSMAELTSCGWQVYPIAKNGQSYLNQIRALDDTGWAGMFYLQAYDITGDPVALTAAEGSVQCGFNRWQDKDGGLWLLDADDPLSTADPRGREKSLYGIIITLDALQLYEITHKQLYLDYVSAAYVWSETHLKIQGNIYWADYYPYNQVYNLSPDFIGDINPGVYCLSYIGGEMDMAVLQARLYRIFGDPAYKLRAIQTSIAILNREVDKNGIFMDDRDAWTDGAFAGDWAREVLPLDPQLTLASLDLRRTAYSIVTNDRTADGHYGGDWSGPVGPNSIWEQKGWTAQMIMTSSSAANMALAAAFLQ